MRRVDLSRQGFLEWVASTRRPASSLGGRSGTGRGDVSLIWLDSNLNGEPIVAVAADEMREFLAFTATYVGTYTPFTAFFRVIPRELVEYLPDRPLPIQGSIKRAIVGATICDAAIQSRLTEKRLTEISIQACYGAPSAVVLNACLLGYDSNLSLSALDRWRSVRSSISNAELVMPVARIQQFWTIALDAFFPNADRSIKGGGDLELSAFLSSTIASGGVATNSGWKGLLQWAPEVEDIAGKLRGTREQRVRALDAVVRDLQNSKLTTKQKEMIVGYVTAQVAEGSFNYLPLAGRIASDLPLAPVWFGLFAGLNENSDVLTAGDCLGRRIERHFATDRNVLPPLNSDVSYEEYLLLSQEGRTASLRTEHQSILDVELMPGVTGRFRLSRPVRASEETERQGFSMQKLRKLIDQLNLAINEVDTSRDPGPLPLFPDSPSGGQDTKRARISRPRKGGQSAG